MASKVETYSDIGIGDKKYVYFDHPPELWVGRTMLENHTTIFERSGREANDISIVGLITVNSEGVAVGALGSRDLHIVPNDPSPVKEYIGGLDGSEGKKIIG